MRTPRVIIGLIRTSEVGLTMQRIRNASVARGTFEVVPKYRRLRTVSECILFIDCAPHNQSFRLRFDFDRYSRIADVMFVERDKERSSV